MESHALNGFILPWISAGILLAQPALPGASPETADMKDFTSPEVIIYLDISGTFSKKSDTKEQIILPDTFSEFLELTNLETKQETRHNDQVAPRSYLEIINSEKFQIFAFSNGVSESSIKDNIKPCKDKENNVKLCLFSADKIINETNPKITRIGAALEDAIEKSRTKNSIYSAIIFTDLVDDCLRKGSEATCLYINQREHINKRISESLSEQENLEVIFYIGATTESDSDLVKRSRNILFQKMHRDLGARSRFVISHNYEWDHKSFLYPHLSLPIEIAPILTNINRVSTATKWSHEAITFQLSRHTRISSIDLYCKNEILRKSIEFSDFSNDTSSLERQDHSSEQGKSYRAPIDPCKIKSCPTQYTLRISSKNSLVEPAKFDPPLALCTEPFNMEILESPELSKSSFISDVIHSNDRLQLEFDAILNNEETIEICFFDAAHTTSKSKIRSPKRNQNFPYLVSNAIARFHINFQGSTETESRTRRRYSCRVAHDKPGSVARIPLDVSLGLATANSLAAAVYVFDGDTQSDQGVDPESPRPCRTEGSIGPLAVSVRPQPNAYLLLILRVVGCLIFISLVIRPFRIIRRVPVLSTLAFLLAATPLLIEIKPHILMTLLRSELSKCLFLSTLWALWFLHLGFLSRSLVGDLTMFYGDSEERSLTESRWSWRVRVAIHLGAVAFLSIFLWMQYAAPLTAESWEFICTADTNEKLTGIGQLQ